MSYQATHTLLLSSTNGNLYTDPVQLNQIQLFATTGEVPERVAKALKVDVGQVAVVASLDQSSGALNIIANRNDPKTAELVADTVADELSKYIVERQDTQLEGRLATSLSRQNELEDRIHDLEDKVADDPNDNVLSAQLEAARSQYIVVVQKYDDLTEETGLLQLSSLQKASAVSITSQGLQAPKSRSSRGLLGGVLGATLGTGLALLLGRLDRRVRTRAQAESIVGARANVIIPAAATDALTRLAVTPNRHDSLSDSFRSLRTVVNFAEAGGARAEGRAPVVLVVSAGPGDGKTSVSANLAAAYMESGNRTLAVNTDFRRPALVQRILGMSFPNLNMTFGEAQSLDPIELVAATLNPNLSLLDLSSIAAAPGQLARLTASSLPVLSSRFDAVVVDTSPITATAEVLELVAVADVVVLAVRLNQTSITAVKRAVEMLRSLEPRHLLLVVVGAPVEKSSYYGYGDTGKGRKRSRRSTEEPELQPTRETDPVMAAR